MKGMAYISKLNSTLCTDPSYSHVTNRHIQNQKVIIERLSINFSHMSLADTLRDKKTSHQKTPLGICSRSRYIPPTRKASERKYHFVGKGLLYDRVETIRTRVSEKKAPLRLPV